MDAFAVSVCATFSGKSAIKTAEALKISSFFGFFQGAMPILGFFLGEVAFKRFAFANRWGTFIILSIIGIRMICTSQKDKKDCPDYFSYCSLLLLAFATSVDAFAAGISLAFVQINIFAAALIIALTTFLITWLGVFTGKRLSKTAGAKAEIAGGAILILLGFKAIL